MASVASKVLIVLFMCFFFIIKCDERHVNYVTICQFDGCVYGKRMASIVFYAYILEVKFNHDNSM